MLDSALSYNLRVFPCRRRRLLFCGEEDRPAGDHRAGAAQGQRVLVKRGGPGRPGQPQYSRYALSGGRNQSAAIYKWQLRHFHTREHTWRTAVSGALTYIIRRECDTDASSWLSPQLLDINWQWQSALMCVCVCESWEITRIFRNVTIMVLNIVNSCAYRLHLWHLWQSRGVYQKWLCIII